MAILRPDMTGVVVSVGDHSPVPGGHLWTVKTDGPPPRDVIYLVDRTIRAASLDVGDRVSLRWIERGRRDSYWEATRMT